MVRGEKVQKFETERGKIRDLAKKILIQNSFFQNLHTFLKYSFASRKIRVHEHAAQIGLRF